MYRNYLNICSYYNLEKVLQYPSPDTSKTVKFLYVSTSPWAGTREHAPVLRGVFHIRTWYLWAISHRCAVRNGADVRSPKHLNYPLFACDYLAALFSHFLPYPSRVKAFCTSALTFLHTHSVLA